MTARSLRGPSLEIFTRPIHPTSRTLGSSSSSELGLTRTTPSWLASCLGSRVHGRIPRHDFQFHHRDARGARREDQQESLRIMNTSTSPVQRTETLPTDLYLFRSPSGHTSKRLATIPIERHLAISYMLPLGIYRSDLGPPLNFGLKTRHLRRLPCLHPHSICRHPSLCPSLTSAVVLRCAISPKTPSATARRVFRPL